MPASPPPPASSPRASWSAGAPGERHSLATSRWNAPLSSLPVTVGGVQVLDRIDRAEIDALRERGEFFWLDLVGGGGGELAGVERVFGLPPLVVEDMRERGQRPKLDDYDGYVLLVFYGAARDGDEVALVEVECVISGDWIITHRDAACTELDELRSALARRAPDEQFVVYRILDTLTDTFFPVLASIDDDIDTIENEVMPQPNHGR